MISGDVQVLLGLLPCPMPLAHPPRSEVVGACLVATTSLEGDLQGLPAKHRAFPLSPAILEVRAWRILPTKDL